MIKVRNFQALIDKNYSINYLKSSQDPDNMSSASKMDFGGQSNSVVKDSHGILSPKSVQAEMNPSHKLCPSMEEKKRTLIINKTVFNNDELKVNEEQ